nr:AEC family transporter [Nereida sp. MMG025]
MEITAPVFLLACIGFVWVKLGFEYRVAFVTRLAMTISVPCLIFVALMETQIPPAALTALSLASVLAYGAVTLLVWILVVALKLNKQTFMAPLIMGNTGNLGLPLALFAFGDVGLGYAVVVFAIMAIYSFTIGIYMVSGGGSPAKMFKEPVVAATLLGALFLWQGWQTPTFLTNALRLTGDMAIPMMLITLGVAVARLTPARLPLAIGLAVAKQVICIGSAAGIGIWLQLEPVALAVLILQVSTPVAVTSYLLAEKYGADAQSVAGLVVVSTVLSLITIPLTLAFLV